eukprot:tig00020704_g13145.t1
MVNSQHPAWPREPQWSVIHRASRSATVCLGLPLIPGTEPPLRGLRLVPPHRHRSPQVGEATGHLAIRGALSSSAGPLSADGGPGSSSGSGTPRTPSEPRHAFAVSERERGTLAAPPDPRLRAAPPPGPAPSPRRPHRPLLLVVAAGTGAVAGSPEETQLHAQLRGADRRLLQRVLLAEVPSAAIVAASPRAASTPAGRVDVNALARRHFADLFARRSLRSVVGELTASLKGHGAPAPSSRSPAGSPRPGAGDREAPRPRTAGIYS